LCSLFGKTRNALYDHGYRQQQEIFCDDIILQYVGQVRKQLPRLGTRKLHHKLIPLLATHGLHVGRDHLFALLDAHKLLIRRRKKKAITTDSRHWMRKYANLAKDLPCSRPEQLWVSDITYLRMGNQWAYLSLITDAYSRKIMGYSLRSDMTVQGCLEALQMAVNNRSYPDGSLVHHSDRGAQYCSAAYIKVLMDNQVGISMTENGDPYENALAERVNGIIKAEFNLYSSQAGFELTSQYVKQCITAYNELRPHSSCDFLTPCQAHSQQGDLKKRWKHYPKKTIQSSHEPCSNNPEITRQSNIIFEKQTTQLVQN
jgi:transposase InsO family protein